MGRRGRGSTRSESRWPTFKWAPCQAATVLKITGPHLNSAAQLLTPTAGKNTGRVCSVRPCLTDCCPTATPGHVTVSGRCKPSKS